MRDDIAGALINDGAGRSGQHRRGRSASMLALAAITLLASLVTLTPAGAADEPADTGDTATDAETQNEAEPDSAPSGVQVVRYAAADAYALSIEVAQALVDSNGGSSEWVVLASGEHWAHAAVAAPLAASLGAPVMLVPQGGLQSPTARSDLVEFLESAGTRRVVIAGSPEILPNHEPSVLFGLGMLPRNIERVHGDDPAGSSIAVAERMGAPAEFGELGHTVIIASDRSVADAVAVGPLAAAGPFPLLLTAPDALDPRITEYLAEHEVAHVVLAGGTAAIAPAVQTAIETAGTTVTRLAGRDRADTARLATELFEQHTADDPTCADSTTRIGLAPARQPEQALTAGPLLAHTCTPLRYTEPDLLPADLRNTLYLSTDAHVTVFGGDSSIPTSALDVEVPPARIAAFNFRPNADRSALIGTLEIIDDVGGRRVYPQASLTRRLDVELPPDWRHGSQRHSTLIVDYWAIVSWSHDGEWLAYRGIDGESLFVLNASSGELRRVDPVGYRVDADAIGSTFHWSPAANKLAFSAVVEEESTLSDPNLTVNRISEYTRELYLYDIESDESVRLTDNNVNDSAGPWSPDGRLLAFAQTPASATWTNQFGDRVAYRWLSVLDIATRESVTLHNDHVLHAAEGGYAGGGLEQVALWSPDGESLAFSVLPGGDRFTAAPQLYVAALGDGAPVRLDHPDCDDCETGSTYFQLPYIRVHGWSPTGGSIAYSAHFQSEELALTQSVEGGDSAELFRVGTASPGTGGVEESAYYIGWTADGLTLLYLHETCRFYDEYPTAEMQIIEVAPDGSRSMTVLDVPPQIGTEYASCRQLNLLAPNGQSIALRDSELGLRVARFGDGVWKTLLSPAQRPPQSAYDSHNCQLEWASDGIRIGCAHSTGDF